MTYDASRQLQLRRMRMLELGPTGRDMDRPRRGTRTPPTAICKLQLHMHALRMQLLVIILNSPVLQLRAACEQQLLSRST